MKRVNSEFATIINKWVKPFLFSNWKCTVFYLILFNAVVTQTKAQQGVGYQDNWQVPNGTVNTVLKIGNTAYIGGSFSYLGYAKPYGTLLNNSDGSPNLSYLNPNGTVLSVVPDGVGGWFICGTFTQVGGQARNYLARINSDGSLNSWNPNVSGIVNSIAISDGLVYVGGSFQYIGGQYRSCLAALDTSTGTPTTWNPNVNDTVLTVYPNGGNIYVGGKFTAIGSQTRNKIACVSSSSGTVTSWNPNANGTVNTITVSGTTVYVGGSFTTISGTTRNYIGAIDAATGVATSWNPASGGTVNTLAVSGTTVYVGGSFTIMGGNYRNNIASVSTNGTVLSWNPNASSTVNTIAVSGTTVYVGGNFSTIGGATRNYIGAVDASTGTATSWNPNALGVINIISVSGNNIYVGGNFSCIGGVNRNNIAAIDITTGKVNNWVQNINGVVNIIIQNGSLLYIGGSFSTIGGVTRNNFGAIDTASNIIIGLNPNPNGIINTLFVSGNIIYAGGSFTSIGGQARNNVAAIDAGSIGGTATSWNPNANGTVNTLAVSGTTVYVGGSFTTMGGNSRNNIASVSTNGTVLSWNPNASSTVNTIAVSGTTVYVGGSFLTINGTVRNKIASVSTNGTVLSWNPNASSTVNTLLVSGTTVYVGGSFTTIGGVTRNRIGAIDASTGTATTWNPNANGSTVYSIYYSGGIIYAGGSFSSMGGNSSRRNFTALLDSSQLPPTPTISTFVPMSGCDGNIITITGANFTGATSVKFGAVNATSFSVVNSTTITAIVGNGASGQISITTPSGSITSSNVFTSNNSPALITPSNLTTFCDGNNVILDANTGTGLTYQWGNNGASINGATNSSYTATTSGSYTVVVTNNTSCSTASFPTIITVNPLPTATITTTGSTTFCAGDYVVLNANTSLGLSYQWKYNGSIINGATNSNYTATLSGNYSVVVTNSNNCSTLSSVTSVTVNSLPNVSAGSNQIICTGQSVTLNGSGAVSYLWNNGVSNSVSFVPNQTTTYTVTGTGANGCINTAQTTVTVNALPTVSGGSNQSICAGQLVTLTGNGTATSYSWNNGVNNGVSFVPANTTTYTVTGTDNNGCTNLANVTVTVGNALSVNAGLDVNVCFGNSVTLNAIANGTIIWSGGITNNQLFTPTLSSWYIATVSNGSGCTGIDSVFVNVNQLPVVNAGIDQTTCYGNSITLSGSGAQSYSWSGNVYNNQSFAPTFTNNYIVTGTDSNGCINKDTVHVTVHLLPNVNAGADQAICLGASTTLTATGAANYTWSDGITNNQYFTPTTTKNYVVIGTDANGCVKKDTITVTVYPLPTVIAGIDQTICPNSSIILSATGAVNYSWNNSVINNQSFTPTSTNYYVVTGTDTYGCTNTDTVSVSIAPLPIALAITNQTAICPNGNASLSASGGATYLWSNGDTSATTTVTQVGNFYVIAVNQFGCIDTSNVIAITQKTLPTQVKIKAVGANSVCEPATVAFVLDMPLGSTIGFGYQWYLSGSPIFGATDSFYNANTTGSYALSISGGDNCLKYSYAKPATIKAAPAASFTATTATTICAGGMVVLVAPSISGCTYTWLKDGVAAGSGNTKSFKLAGNYTVIAKLNGCSDTASPTMPIVVNPLPVSNVAALNTTTFCAGDSCTIVASPIGAVSYEWHNGNFILDTTTTEQYTIGITATIKVLVKDANGCIGKLSTTNVKTKANAVPLASISSNGSTTISSTGNVKLKATPSSGVTWQWYKDGNAINNATANSYIANSGGNYTVAITKLGCTGLSSGVFVTQTNPKTEAVTVVNGNFEMTAFPNPVNDGLTINISGIEVVDGTIMVMDYSGKLLTTQLMSTSTLNLDMKPFASGVYLIRYKGKDGKVSTLKVVKE